jgi:hypothetical protein
MIIKVSSVLSLAIVLDMCILIAKSCGGNCGTLVMLCIVF